MARRSNNSVGAGLAALLGLGLILMVLRYTWPVLLAGSAGCLGTYLVQVWKDKQTAAEIRQHKDYQERVRRDREEADQVLAAAQPQTADDSFATCPKCSYTTMQMIFVQTDAGTTRRCVSCAHEWTINHEKRVS